MKRCSIFILAAGGFFLAASMSPLPGESTLSSPAALLGEWKLNATASGNVEPVLTGAGVLALGNLIPGEYILRVDPGVGAESFPVLFPGGIKKTIPASAAGQSLAEFTFSVRSSRELVYLGGRNEHAFFRSIEIESKDGALTQKIGAGDLARKLPLPEIPLSTERIREVAALLPEQPAAMGPKIDNREAWAAFARRNPNTDYIAKADEILKTPPPALPDELFLRFKTKGNRRDYEVPYEDRRRRLRVLVMAECLTNEGKYLPGIEREIETILAEKTWVLPAHDRELENFNGKIVDVDLGVVVRGVTLATAYSWLGNRLSEPLRQKIEANLRRRVTDPYLSRIRNRDKKLCWWVTVTSNWNAVCHEGVVGTALAILPSREERAEFVVGAETYLPFYLSGLAEDGYCDEGLGYWNYGFGHYILLAETLRQAMGGRIDLYDAEAIRRTTTFPQRLQMQAGVYPAFGDCPPGMKPYTWVHNLSCLRVSGYLPEIDVATETANNPTGGTLYEMAVAAFTEMPAPSAKKEAQRPALRDWFDSAAVLICRQSAGVANRFSVAVKGGRNAGTHYHRDLGEFLVAFDGEMLLVDPGIEVYTGRDKYEGEINNSLGHSTPIVDGKGQRSGLDAEAKVMRKEFTPERDVIDLDLTTAYAEPALKKLTRRCAYSRAGKGMLEVTDTVEFREPKNFGAALVTYGQVRLVSDSEATVTRNGKSVRLTVSSGLSLRITSEPVKTINKTAPTRIVVKLKEPAVRAEIKYTIQPD